MKQAKLKMPLFYGCQFTKGEIFRLQEKENSYENEDGYICQKWFVESNPAIFELIEEPKEEVIEGYAWERQKGKYHFVKPDQPIIEGAIDSILILNPKKRKEYVGYLSKKGLSEMQRGETPMYISMNKDKNYYIEITITVEDE